jgi:hypothetical protein
LDKPAAPTFTVKISELNSEKQYVLQQTFSFLVPRHLKFSSSQQKFEGKFTIFIHLLRNECAVYICSSTTQQFFQLPVAPLPIVLPHAGILH